MEIEKADPRYVEFMNRIQEARDASIPTPEERRELENELVIKYFNLEIKFSEISDLFKEMARIHLRLRQPKKEP